MLAVEVRSRSLFSVLFASLLLFGSVTLAPLSKVSAFGSSVEVTGKTGCTWLNKNLNAKKVTIRLDSGVSKSASPGSISGVYSMTFPKVNKDKNGGEWATATIECSQFSFSPGKSTVRVYLKPDWRNHIGNVNFYCDTKSCWTTR